MSRTPVFVVCSSRPRVGKTLLARLLAEYFKSANRPVLAFDANPDNFTLVDHLPADTAIAHLYDVRGEMALFDQLVAPDRVPKVVDLEPALFDRFFTVVQEIDLLRETHRNGIACRVLFLADADPRSSHAYKVLRQRLPGVVLLPVFNESLPGMDRCREAFPVTGDHGVPIAIPRLSPVIRSVIERHSFSFSDYLAETPDQTSELHAWTRRMFVQFQEIELRILLNTDMPVAGPR